MVMGAAGAGKSTVGTALANRLGCPFVEGDDFHSDDNRQKMAGGVPLTDRDRQPWLTAISQAIAEIMRHGGDAVIACSALKERYRTAFREQGVRFIYLKASFETLAARLRQRSGHFFHPALLESQLDAMEEPADAIVVCAEQPVSVIVRRIMSEIPLRSE